MELRNRDFAPTAAVLPELFDYLRACERGESAARFTPGWRCPARI
jgi:hypothetical protein